VVKPLVLEVCSLQGPRFNTSWVQTIPWGHTPGEKPAIYPDPCRETSEGAVHGSHGISQGAQAGPDTQGYKKNLFDQTDLQSLMKSNEDIKFCVNICAIL
jgi:hypothetical protein